MKNAAIIAFAKTGGITPEAGSHERGEVSFVIKPVGRDDSSAPQPVPATVEYAYSYDDIGNLTTSIEQSPGGSQLVATAYTANSLNQYSSISTSDFGHQTSDTYPQYDLDGNMTRHGEWTYTYDAANRLKTVSTNGVTILTNFYDAKSRRVRKITPEYTSTFFYDGWDLIEEQIAYTNGTSTTIHYHWGKDLSGTIGGAAGVGGLLYLTVDGTVYVPFYDAYGNILGYRDAQGNVVASYTYDAFGNTISQSGPLAYFFRHRFSTKYFDADCGLYYYGYRYYSPVLMRWLTRDQIEESGGVNLYAMCGNSLPFCFDDLGLWRMITGAYLVREDTAKRVEYKYAMQILLFIDELNKLRDQQGNRIYNAKIKDLVKTPFAEVRKDIQNNPDNVYLVAHCGLIYNGENWRGRCFVWDESHVADEVVDIYHDGTRQTLLGSFGSSLKIENVYGCYLMSGYRKVPISGTSKQVSYKVSLDVLMPTFFITFKSKIQA